jgi:predicted MPP superfamily phosphohydrolase
MTARDDVVMAVRTRRKVLFRRITTGATVLAVSIAGMVLGLLLAARVQADVGPFRAELAITPALTGDTSVLIPPLGALHLDSHDGPAHLRIRLGSLDQVRTQDLIDDPSGISRASRTAIADLQKAVTRVGAQALGTALLGALALGAVVFRDVRRVAWTGGLALALTGASVATAAATFRISAVEEPRYEGLLVNAPAVVGDVSRIADRYEEYAAQLQRLVSNVSRIYATVSSLPVFEADEDTVRLLHVSDLHLNPAAWSVISTAVEQFGIDLVVDTGDIVDWGSSAETGYVEAIGELPVPYVYVRGNHDSVVTQSAVANQPNAIVLDNTVVSVAGLTLAGIGDPRFTPDQQELPHEPVAQQVARDRVVAAGATLAGTITATGAQVDLAVVHDPLAADPLAGSAPIVLAGHTHRRELRAVPPLPSAAPDATRTALLVQGSTGGAGLRGLEGEEATPLALSVLYFDSERSLVAYDDILVGGTGQSEVNLVRTIYSYPEESAEDTVPLDGSPTSTDPP